MTIRSSCIGAPLLSRFAATNLDLDGIALVNALVGEHLADGGAALVTTHGAYAAPPVRTKLLELA